MKRTRCSVWCAVAFAILVAGCSTADGRIEVHATPGGGPLTELPARSWPSFEATYRVEAVDGSGLTSVTMWELVWREDGTWEQEVVASETLGWQGDGVTIGVHLPVGYRASWDGQEYRVVDPEVDGVHGWTDANVDRFSPHDWFQPGYFTAHEQFTRELRDAFVVHPRAEGGFIVRRTTPSGGAPGTGTVAGAAVPTVEEWTLRPDLLIEAYRRSAEQMVEVDVQMLEIVVTG